MSFLYTDVYDEDGDELCQEELIDILECEGFSVFKSSDLTMHAMENKDQLKRFLCDFVELPYSSSNKEIVNKISKSLDNGNKMGS